MAYKVPSLEEMLQILVALFKALLPDRNIGSRFTPAWKFVKTIAGAATDIHAHVSSGLKDVMPDTSRGAALDRFLKIFAPGGIDTRKGATPARKSQAGRVTGIVGSTTSIGDQLIHRASGLLFQVNSSGTIPSSPTQVDVDIVAIDKGSQTRLEAGQVLEFLTPPTGLATIVTLVKALDEDGTDAEVEGAARNRLLAALAKPAAGGNQADYVAWALAQLGISQAFCYPNRAGIGTVDVAALHSGTGTARALTPSERTILLNAIKALAPTSVAGVPGALRILTTVPETTNVEVTITPTSDASVQFDWDDSTPPVVLSWTSATRTLQFSTARPSSMVAGHRIVLKGVGSSQDGAPFTIESLSSTDAVVLEKAPTVAPAATDIVYAGGKLTSTIRDAIVEHINGGILYAGSKAPQPASTAGSLINLEQLIDGIGTANPNGAYGAWRGTLLRDALATIAIYTRGVRKQTIVTPVADVDATDYAYPTDYQVGYLIPGYVLVRKAP